MDCSRSGQSAEHDSYHGNIDHRRRTGFRALVIAHQAPLFHQPAKRALHYPAPGQHLKSLDSVAPAHDLHHQLRADRPHPVGKGRARIAAIDPHNPQPGKPPQHSAQQPLGSRLLRGAGGRDPNAQNQPQRIDQQMPFATLGFLGGIVADRAARDRPSGQSGCRRCSRSGANACRRRPEPTIATERGGFPKGARFSSGGRSPRPWPKGRLPWAGSAREYRRARHRGWRCASCAHRKAGVRACAGSGGAEVGAGPIGRR